MLTKVIGGVVIAVIFACGVVKAAELLSSKSRKRKNK